MSPKFRGGSDDWLDDEDSVKGTKKPSGDGRGKPARREAGFLAAEEGNATVCEVFKDQCRVWLDGQTVPEPLLCSYRRAEVVGGQQTERTPVAVGDRVRAEETGDRSGVIEGLCARANFLSRPAPGREAQEHVIAANMDRLLVVASVTHPDFSPGLLDRYLVAASAAGIPALIAVTKTELHLPGAAKAWDTYRDLGYEISETSAKQGRGVDELRTRLTGEIVAFCGHSGVGKTSLLRSLTGRELGKVGEVSDANQRGRHTTTSAVMLEGPAGSRWIDTPGVREFGLRSIPPGELRLHFPEFARLACAQGGCLHREESGCLAAGLPRYVSYRRILESLLLGEN
jgi:ribosome biogenesis GTPase